MFKPTHSNFRKQYGIPGDKYIVLGVSFAWGYRKGLDCFAEMAEKLGDKYQIVLVGTDGEIDKNLPKNIISIHRTQNQKELAEIYSTADVFAMPTREENYPTVNMEAIACGTPVVTFDTGGSPEMLNEKVGRVVPVDDVNKMMSEIRKICENMKLSSEAFRSKAKEYIMEDRFLEYIDLYKSMHSENDGRG